MESVKLELTKELKDKLNGYLLFDVEDTFKYVPKVFRDNIKDKSIWTIFTLRSLNGLELAELENKSGYREVDFENKQIKFFSQSGAYRVYVLQQGIKSWKNVYDEKGNIISNSGNMSIDELIKKLPVNLQIELQNAIQERSLLNEDELRGLE
jgi:hypothetical protein